MLFWMLSGFVMLIVISAMIGGKEGVGMLFLTLFVLIADAVVSAVVGFGVVFVIDVNSLHGHYPVQFMTSMTYLISSVCFVCAGSFFLVLILEDIVAFLVWLGMTITGIVAIVHGFTNQKVVYGISIEYVIIGLCLMLLCIACLGTLIKEAKDARISRQYSIRSKEEDEKKKREAIKRERQEAPKRAEREKKEALEKEEKKRRDDIRKKVTKMDEEGM